MKNVALILLISVYAISSLGIGINGFYCCGKLQSVEFNIVTLVNDKYNNGGGKDGCCETDPEFYGIRDSRFVFSEMLSCYRYVSEINSDSYFFAIADFLHYNSVRPDSRLTPPVSRAIYLLNCVFRI